MPQEERDMASDKERLEKAKSLYVYDNYDESVPVFKELANNGMAEAMYWLGVSYSDGNGVVQNYEEAARLWRSAIAKGFKNAQIDLDKLINAGKLKSSSSSSASADANPEAEKLFEQGAEACDDAEFEEAVKLMTKAADMGHTGAMCALANYYESGWGVETDEEKAFKLYTKAADMGDVNAWYQLGLSYETGTGVAEDEAKAIQWYTKAAAQGNEEAQEKLTERGIKW